MGWPGVGREQEHCRGLFNSGPDRGHCSTAPSEGQQGMGSQCRVAPRQGRAGSGVTWRGANSPSASVCPATLLTTSSRTLCCQTAQMARAAGKASWGPEGPVCPSAVCSQEQSLRSWSHLRSPGRSLPRGCALSLGMLLPLSPSWDRSAAALPSYLPRASPPPPLFLFQTNYRELAPKGSQPGVYAAAA